MESNLEDAKIPLKTMQFDGTEVGEYSRTCSAE